MLLGNISRNGVAKMILTTRTNLDERYDGDQVENLKNLMNNNEIPVTMDGVEEDSNLDDGTATVTNIICADISG